MGARNISKGARVRTRNDHGQLVAAKSEKNGRRTNRDLLDDIADALLEKETIDYTELYSLVGTKYPELAAAQQANFPPDMSARPP